jgi:simple sugar transport system ATP-binding protein
MRAGRVVATRPVSEDSRNDLIEWVVGRDVPEAAACARSGAPGEEVALQVRDLAVDGDLKPDACADVDLEVRRGEILCILGVAGNGQQELAQAVMGLRRRRRGVVRLFGEAAPPLAPWWMIERGAGYVPCDETGLVLAMRCAENLVIKDFWRKPFSRLGFLCCRLIEDRSQGLVRRHGIASHNPYLSTRHLSGGNRQKLVLAREFSRGPRVIIADQPTRGLDVVAAEETRRWLVSVANGEGAVLWITTECDEAMAVADRISVMVRGRLIRPVARSEADATALGLLMSGVEAKAGSVP